MVGLTFLPCLALDFRDFLLPFPPFRAARAFLRFLREAALCFLVCPFLDFLAFLDFLFLPFLAFFVFLLPFLAFLPFLAWEPRRAARAFFMFRFEAAFCFGERCAFLFLPLRFLAFGLMMDTLMVPPPL